MAAFLKKERNRMVKYAYVITKFYGDSEFQGEEIQQIFLDKELAEKALKKYNDRLKKYNDINSFCQIIFEKEKVVSRFNILNMLNHIDDPEKSTAKYIDMQTRELKNFTLQTVVNIQKAFLQNFSKEEIVGFTQHDMDEPIDYELQEIEITEE
jgi:hypothetical protein